MNLHDALRTKLKISDAGFGALCEPPISRTAIWAYRTGARAPDSPQLVSVLAALKARGVELTAADVLARPVVRVPRKRSVAERRTKQRRTTTATR